MRKKMKAKVCLCGEGAVGKTSTIRKFVYDTFDDSYVTTIGTKVTKKVVNAEYPERDLQVEVKMLIWDIMGQRDFLDVSDPIALLTYLFADGSPPAGPFPDCGFDTTPDGLVSLTGTCRGRARTPSATS